MIARRLTEWGQVLHFNKIVDADPVSSFDEPCQSGNDREPTSSNPAEIEQVGEIVEMQHLTPEDYGVTLSRVPSVLWRKIPLSAVGGD